MGLLRFEAFDRAKLEQLDVARVLVTGIDELPWLAHVFVTGNQLIIQRAESESGCVSIPWNLAEQGEWLLTTSTLAEREAPYLLELELARGCVHRLRTQQCAWEQLGLVVPESVRDLVHAATHAFGRAATRQSEPATCAEHAEQSVNSAAAAASLLATEYANQALSARMGGRGKLGTLLGVNLGPHLPADEVRKSLIESFNLVAIPTAWRSVEASEGQRFWDASDSQLRWAQQAGLKVAAGPLIEFDERRVPDWTYLWESDFETLASFMLDHVRNVVHRYRGRTHLWHVASRVNRQGVLGLTEEDRLSVVAQAIRTVRELDNRAPIVVSFDQPWAEYMAHQRVELAPIHLADALVRADIGLSGIGLELNIGPQPRATTVRSPLALSRLIDSWSQFDLPLLVSLTYGVSSSKSNNSAICATAESWLRQNLPLLLAKNCVQIVVWNQLTDIEAEFPHAGLFDESAQPKRAFAVLGETRSKYLL